jgi:hypothetical protein
MTNFAEKNRPRIVFDLTVHREMFYRVDTYTHPFVPAIITESDQIHL